MRKVRRKSKLILKSLAIQSFKQAGLYYKSKGGENLKQSFKRSFVKTSSHIQDYPLSYSIKYGEIREAPIPNFPYLIIYKVEEDQIIVFDIFNTHQDPERKPNV